MRPVDIPRPRIFNYQLPRRINRLYPSEVIRTRRFKQFIPITARRVLRKEDLRFTSILSRHPIQPTPTPLRERHHQILQVLQPILQVRRIRSILGRPTPGTPADKDTGVGIASALAVCAWVCAAAF